MKHTIRTRVGGALLSFAMVLSLLPVSALAVEDPSVDPAEGSSTSAPAEGTQGSQAGTASDPTKQSIIEIDSNDDLVNAIQNQKNGQTWVFTKAGTYDTATPETDGNNGGYNLPDGVDMPYPGGQMASHPGPYAFPIYTENLTIKKADNVDGEVIITSSAVPTATGGPATNGGYWNWQSFMIISGSGVTIEGVTLKGNQNAVNVNGYNGLYGKQCDKIIETVDGAGDLILRDVVIAPLTVEGETGNYAKYNGTQRSGSIYFSHAYDTVKTVTLENVYTYGGIKSVNNVNITLNGVTIDATNNTYADYNSSTASYAWNPGIRGDGTAESLSNSKFGENGFTIKVDDSIDFRQIFNDSLLDGSTVELTAGNYAVDNAININHSVTVVGAGTNKTMLQAAIEPATLIQVAGGNVNFSMSGIYVKGLENNTHNNSSALTVGSDVVPSTGAISITDCKFTDFTKNSITVKGGTATISGNEIVCKGYPGAAGNGIQIDQYATATVRNNQISGYVAQSDVWGATGIMALRNGKITTLSGNTLANCQTALCVTTLYATNDQASFPSDMSSNTITNCTYPLNYELDGDGDLAAMLASALPGTSISLYGAYTLNSAVTVKDGVSLYLADGGTYYGDGNLTVAEGGSLTVAEGGTLWVDKGITLTGDVANYGTVENYGTLTGNVTGNGTYIIATLVKDADELKAAIASAQPGAVIVLDDDIVLDDTLAIDKSITIDGNGHTISTTAISTPIAAINGETTNYSAIIAATNNSNVVLKNLTVKGDPEKASSDEDLTHNTRYVGVAAINANLTMEGCKVLDITYTQGPDGLQGMQNGFGIYAVSDNTNTLTLNNTEISNFNKTAVIVRDKVNLKMNGCTITGFGEQAIIGQNGIQYAGNATIQNTKISGLIYNAENEWKNCSTAIYNVSTGTTTNTVLQNVVCENVDSSYYTTGGTTSISGGSFVHVGDGNAAVAGDEGVSIVITGGKFDSDVNKYLAPGYVMDSNGNVYNPSTGGGSSSTGDYLITVDKTTGGKVTVNPGRADKGDEVTITVKPNDGYELDQLSVTDKDGDSVKVTNKGNGKYTFTMPGSQITIKATFKATESSALDNFTDVNSNAWYADAAEFVIEEGLMTGTSDTTFAPDTSMSRAMIWTVLAAYNGANTSGGNPWYAPSQQWAMINGVSDGSAPNGSITREQLAVMLWRAAGSPSTSKNLTGYADANAVSDWAVEALAWAVDNGIISGMSGSSLAPQNTATRAQVAVMLMQFVECMDA